MVHPRPVILALLIAVAAPATVMAVSTPSPQSSMATAPTTVQVYAPENTSTVLTLGEDADETRAFVRPSLDLGTTLDVQKRSMDHQFSHDSFATQFEQADTRGDKRDLLIKFATEIDTQTLKLEAREKTARQGFRNGSISAAEYVQTLVLINAEAKYLQKKIEVAKEYANDVDDFTLSGYFGPYEKRLVSLQGPIREELASTFRGNAPAKRYYVSVADNGVILSYIENGIYHREILRLDHRELEGNEQFTGSAARDRSKKLYPWTWEEENGLEWTPNVMGLFDKFTLFHNHGAVSGNFDRSSGLVFHEFQQKYLTSTAADLNGRDETRPKGPGVTANESGLVLTVNRSYAGGPMYVALQDNETGEYVEGTIAIDGETVGETSTDGGLWTLSPTGSFNVSASSGLDIVAVETRATRPIQNYNVTED